MVDGFPRTSDVSDCRIVSAPLSWRPQTIGGPSREYRLQGIAAQDPTEGSLWDLVWELGDRPAMRDRKVDVILRPAGGVVASPEQPEFYGTVVVSESDGTMIGGPANVSTTARFTFEFDWLFLDKPTRSFD